MSFAIRAGLPEKVFYFCEQSQILKIGTTHFQYRSGIHKIAQPHNQASQFHHPLGFRLKPWDKAGLPVAAIRYEPIHLQDLGASLTAYAGVIHPRPEVVA